MAPAATVERMSFTHGSYSLFHLLPLRVREVALRARLLAVAAHLAQGFAVLGTVDDSERALNAC